VGLGHGGQVRLRRGWPGWGGSRTRRICRASTESPPRGFSFLRAEKAPFCLWWQWF